jgi:hypothetical protein
MLRTKAASSYAVEGSSLATPLLGSGELPVAASFREFPCWNNVKPGLTSETLFT